MRREHRLPEQVSTCDSNLPTPTLNTTLQWPAILRYRFPCGRCTLFERTAREGGLPAPEACALCNPPCPSNIGTSVVDFTRAFQHDVVTAVELARACLGPNGFQMCVCNVFMLLKERNMQLQPATDPLPLPPAAFSVSVVRSPPGWTTSTTRSKSARAAPTSSRSSWTASGWPSSRASRTSSTSSSSSPSTPSRSCPTCPWSASPASSSGWTPTTKSVRRTTTTGSPSSGAASRTRTSRTRCATSSAHLHSTRCHFRARASLPSLFVVPFLCAGASAPSAWPPATRPRPTRPSSRRPTQPT